jgi:hypothetical protein
MMILSMRYNVLNKDLAVGIIIIMICIPFFTSCKKEFLNVTPNHHLSEQTFYKTKKDFKQAVTAVYSDLQEYIKHAHILQEGRSDNTTYDNLLDQGWLGGNRQLGFMDQFVMNSSATIISNAWDRIYETIKDCNVPLSRLKDSDIDQNIAKKMEGQLRFFRAYFYFVAVRYWGDIPLLLKPIDNAKEAFQLSRTPKDSVYKTIIKDAEFAESALPDRWSEKDKGKITSGAAKMLLAKVYMTKKNYKAAEKKLKDIVSSNVYSLNPSYAAIFDPSKKNGPGSILEVQFKEGPEGESSNFIYQFAPVGSPDSLVPGPGVGGGLNLPTLTMVQAYESGDLRKNVSIRSFMRGGLRVYYIKKYAHANNSEFNRTPDNWPIYRYADVLLMLAEAINDQGYKTGKPFKLLNQVRNRAGLSSLTPTDLPNQYVFNKALAHERRVEFAFENHRWFYLLRTDTAIKIMTAYGKKEVAHPTTRPTPGFLPFDETSFNVTQYKLLYPIPGQEVDKDPNIKQNPGW